MTSSEITHSPLQIILEGKIFEEQPFGGISRIYQEILPRICSMDEDISFSIPTSGRLMQSLPSHPQITGYPSRASIPRLLRPQAIFWPLQDYLRIKIEMASLDFSRNTLWHATYFQLPRGWEGPKIVTVYDLIPEKHPQFFNKGYDNVFRERKKRAILAADKVICISESARADVVETYELSGEHVATIPLAYGANFRQMSREEIPSNFLMDRPFILYVGMRNHYKNFTTLLNTYAVWSHKDEIQLVVVGSPFSKQEQEEITAARLDANVICLTGITDEGLCALYNQALAFVYPSLSEGFGIPLLEAMACGCPVVAARIPVFIEVAKDVPYFFDPLDKEELIAALEAACFSRETKRDRKSVLANYSWDHTARATLEIYRELTLCN